MSREVIHYDERQAPKMLMRVNRLGQQGRSQNQDHGLSQDSPV